jgi:hypothetical protein
MAVLQLENGKIYKEIGAIASQLATLYVQNNSVKINESSPLAIE